MTHVEDVDAAIERAEQWGFRPGGFTAPDARLLAAEVVRLRAENEELRVKVQRIEKLCSRMDVADTGWRHVVNVATRNVPMVNVGTIRATLKGDAS